MGVSLNVMPRNVAPASKFQDLESERLPTGSSVWEASENAWRQFGRPENLVPAAVTG